MRNTMKTNKRYNLLIATDSYLPRWDGVSRFLYETVPSLSETFDVTLLAPDFGEVKAPKNVKLVRFAVRGIRIGDYPVPTSDRKTVAKLVDDADVVFTQTIGPIGRDAIREASRQKKPVAAFIHSIEWELVPKSISKFKRTLGFVAKQYARLAYRTCSTLLVPSEDTAKILRFAKITTRQKIVHLGCNTKRFAPGDKVQAKHAVKIDPKFTIVGFCGRIAREKDLPTLYHAFRHLEQQHSNLRLLIVGSGLDLSRIFSSMKNIIWVKSTNTPEIYLQAMDLFAMPSLTETSSLATMEAMSCGLPVVASYVGHIKHYISDGQNGFFFPRQDWEFLAEKLDMLIKNRKLQERIGRAARRTIVQQYSWCKTISMIVDELSLLAKGK